MGIQRSLISEYIARQTDPKDVPAVVFWALNELRRVQTSTQSIGEVLIDHENTLKDLVDALVDPDNPDGGVTPPEPCEPCKDGTDGTDGTDGRGVMVFQQDSTPSSTLSAPGDIWFVT